ncbi:MULTISPECIES: extensin family protein [unclassified Bradyrhizobium]|uniref:extensin family protein n=1 Tax=unclassified Bradyrhizobium TaxID=2631580 RepID=UPI0004891AB2|nr:MULTISPECIES: extensin family protein [unclassified Bradyrhizobium]MCP3464357.1 extensin family protein [Bradyrhizobium sp. CCGUVB23]
MTRGVRLYLVGSIVLVSLAGCGRGFFQAEREPWRAEAEAACLKSGAVKESAEIVRIEPISGPGACGAEFPLKVAAIGEASSSFGFADEELRPPASIGNQPRWPGSQPSYPQGQNYPNQAYPNASSYPQRQNQPSGYGGASGPISLSAPGVAPPEEDEIDLPPEGTDAAGAARYMNAPSYPARPNYPSQSQPSYSQRPEQQPLPRLGPAQGSPVGAVGPVAVKPTATLACPIVSELDRWFADTVQPSAMRWFGQRVVEIKQISAYSCRGMNGNPHAHISEHAFGNALDIAAFTLADGRRISVKDGWRGLPEEQGFLRDVQSGACAHFTTVLAPGSNVYHYDHIHVDLMRRASRRLICQPAAVSGDEVAARAQQRNPYANSRDPYVTGSLGRKAKREKVNEEDEFEDE